MNKFQIPDNGSFILPDWIDSWVEENRLAQTVFDSIESKMELAISLGLRHIEEKTGGPFAAIIFEENSGEVISLGVNIVKTFNNSCLHAEMVAFMLAQKKVGSHSLSEDKTKKYCLMTTSQPCAMCYGATPWSGISSLAYGTTKEDVENIVGFDEGVIPENWKENLQKRNIKVYSEILRDKAALILKNYIEKGGELY